MRAQLLAALAIAVLAGACGEAASQRAAPDRSRSAASSRTRSTNRANPASKIAIRRAIYDSGSACKTVTEAGYVQEYGNLSMWTASCASGKSFGDVRRSGRLDPGPGLQGK